MIATSTKSNDPQPRIAGKLRAENAATKVSPGVARQGRCSFNLDVLGPHAYAVVTTIDGDGPKMWLKWSRSSSRITKCAFRLWTLHMLREVENGKCELAYMITPELTTQPIFVLERIRQDMATHGGKPEAVPEEVWQRASCGDIEAIREANNCEPGCVFLNDGALSLILHYFAVAMHSLNPDHITMARGMLSEMCIPPAKAMQRPHVSPEHLRMAAGLYQEILTVREVMTRAFTKLPRSQRLARIMEWFPDLEHIRPSYRTAILHIPEERSGQLYTPVDAAAMILGKIIGYEVTSFRKALDASGLIKAKSLHANVRSAVKAILADMR